MRRARHGWYGRVVMGLVASAFSNAVPGDPLTLFHSVW
jgi:hypothetical protein